MITKTCTVCGEEFTHESAWIAGRKLGGHMTKHNVARRKKKLVAVRTQPERATIEIVAPPPPKERKPTVRWSDDELYSVIAATAATLLGDPMGNPLTMVQKAQEQCILAHRQRVIGTWAALPPDTRTRIGLEVLRLIEKDKKAAITAALEERGVEVLKVEVPVHPDPAKFLKGVATPVLLTELFTRLQGSLGFLQNLAHMIPTPSGNGNGHSPPPQQPPPAPPAPPAPEAGRKPRIAVVGLFKDQFEHVVEKCRDREVELVWVDKDLSKTSYPSVQGIIVQRHTQHRWHELARTILPPERVYFADGGNSSVIQRVYDFTSRHKTTV